MKSNLSAYKKKLYKKRTRIQLAKKPDSYPDAKRTLVSMRPTSKPNPDKTTPERKQTDQVLLQDQETKTGSGYEIYKDRDPDPIL